MHNDSAVAACNLLICCDQQVSDGPSSLDPHFGSHAASAAATQLSQWLTSQPSAPSLQSALDALEHTFSVSLLRHHIISYAIHGQYQSSVKYLVHNGHGKQVC